MLFLSAVIFLSRNGCVLALPTWLLLRRPPWVIALLLFLSLCWTTQAEVLYAKWADVRQLMDNHFSHGMVYYDHFLKRKGVHMPEAWHGVPEPAPAKKRQEPRH